MVKTDCEVLKSGERAVVKTKKPQMFEQDAD